MAHVVVHNRPNGFFDLDIEEHDKVLWSRKGFRSYEEAKTVGDQQVDRILKQRAADRNRQA
jgi:hypothetical protein